MKKMADDSEFFRKGRLSAASFFASGIELLRVVMISLLIIVPVRYFLIQPFYVKGASMEPNFFDNEYLVVDEISYRFSEPQRGDIVVLKYPRDIRQYFIKRIIGLPGERVRVADGFVYINGLQLGESAYLDKSVLTHKEDIWVLKDDEYFVLGDNRIASLDSRDFGPIRRSHIVGKTWIRGWPLHKLTVFETPEYSNQF
ncbi:MAG: signal peptidase I [Parcubacteria group bacterium Gr01-1014_18]|nr:MAG: signal peptidase I [Parcubacteria group bacterium Greene0416_36]TSC81286.1 MAG: signal peptidase I [Parcubacteria group bacterium Gr01-1014_18]TSC99308.1 MAG: signal peptidase I [Parcubacteria group bacterium Greene1014_20]TSD06855.1 MAG: signal peptidase I [Parcubacteria group bacterium Greene0714_2]